ncbi:MAG TPA: hypothetical protein VIS96_11415 [Terrimicrobiaceae bacterium]
MTEIHPRFDGVRRGPIEATALGKLKLEKGGFDVTHTYRYAKLESVREGHAKASQ